MRRRDERRPVRLPRVGDRPAGADSGEDLTIPVFNLEAGDLGFRTLRGRGAATLGVLVILLVEDDLVSRKVEGLTKSLVAKEVSEEPLTRFEKMIGSTFSASLSSGSEDFRFPGEVVETAVRCLALLTYGNRNRIILDVGWDILLINRVACMDAVLS